MNKIFKLITMAIMIASTFLLMEQGMKGEFDVGNLAATYTKYTGYYNIWTAKPKYAYKDNYIGSSKVTMNTYSGKYKELYSWKGPTDLKKKISYTDGTSRSTSFGGGIEVSYVKASSSYSYQSSKSKTVSTKFTFPGDKKLHTLYQTRRDKTIEGYTKRTSYIAYPTSYTWIPGIASWNISWGAWQRYSSRDLSNRKTADTAESIYGHYMN